jgi:hypothetical protein
MWGNVFEKPLPLDMCTEPSKDGMPARQIEEL